MDVPVQLEVRVILPARQAQPTKRLDDALAEARKALDQPLAYDFTRAIQVQWPVEPQNGVDHHQVRRPVHVEPCRVGAAHLLGAHRRSDLLDPEPTAIDRPPASAPTTRPASVVCRAPRRYSSARDSCSVRASTVLPPALTTIV